MTTIMPVDITNVDFKANPFPFYAQLRAEAPVFPMTLPDKRPAWLLTRYDDVQMVLKDEERFVKDRANAMSAEQMKKGPWMPPMIRAIERNMLSVDSPDHTRLRALVHRAFTPRLVEQMRDSIQVLTNELLDGVEAKGRMETLADFALPLPLTVIARILGVPTEDNPKFHRWSKAVIAAASSRNFFTVLPSLMGFLNYLRKLIKKRQQHPQDDLVTALVQAKEGSDTLSDDEIVAMIFLLLVAGHETTVNLIGSGTLALLENPDQMERLRREPTIIKPAIEELLRFTCPVEMATERFASEDVVIAGTKVARGELVVPVLGSANRDERTFENPDALDLGRENNKHLSFGLGVHYCLGAPLSRLEGQIAILALLQRMPNLRLGVAPEQVRWRGTMFLRGLEELPVVF